MSRSPKPPTRPADLTRRQALKVGLGLGAAASLGGEACVPVANRCAGGPVDPRGDAGASGDGGARAALLAVNTIVVVMMENRSFDNMLGALRMDAAYAAAARVDGLTGRETNPDASGNPVPLTRMIGNGTLNPNHDWASSHTAFDGGRCDGFVRVNAGADQQQAMGYYDRAAMPFLYALADQYVVCDRWFSSVMGPTWPNRFYLHAATADGRTSNVPMGLAAPPTIWDAMAQRCWSARNYYAGSVPWYSAAFPSKSFSGNDTVAPATIDNFYRDAARGELPAFSLIDPDFEVNDAHPPHDLALAEAFVASIYNALAAGPQWPSALLVIVFDEHGGLFDHVPPAACTDPNPSFRQLGFRVPAIVAGPRARRGAVVSTPFEHVSIASTLAARFGIASLGARMDATADLSSCLEPSTLAEAGPGAARPCATPSLPRVTLSAARSLRAPLRHTSQPELARLARAGGVPAHHVDPRPGADRVRAWLRHAQELDAVRVVA